MKLEQIAQDVYQSKQEKILLVATYHNQRFEIRLNATIKNRQSKKRSFIWYSLLKLFFSFSKRDNRVLGVP
jgi:hypothetical protein